MSGKCINRHSEPQAKNPGANVLIVILNEVKNPGVNVIDRTRLDYK